MLLDELLKKVSPNLRGPMKMHILSFALAHRALKKGPGSQGSVEFELVKIRASESAAVLKSAPYHLKSDVLAGIIKDPGPWIDEIYDTL